MPRSVEERVGRPPVPPSPAPVRPSVPPALCSCSCSCCCSPSWGAACILRRAVSCVHRALASLIVFVGAAGRARTPQARASTWAWRRGRRFWRARERRAQAGGRGSSSHAQGLLGRCHDGAEEEADDAVSALRPKGLVIVQGQAWALSGVRPRRVHGVDHRSCYGNGRDAAALPLPPPKPRQVPPR